MIRNISAITFLLLSLVMIVPEGTAAATIDLAWKTNTHHGTTFINQGDTVRWTWQDTRPHTVAATGGLFNSGSLTGSGTQFSFTFNTPGSFHYFCMIHGAPSMGRHHRSSRSGFGTRLQLGNHQAPIRLTVDKL